MDLSRFYYNDEYMIENIFTISSSIFNISKFNDRKVKFNPMLDVILIPNLDDYCKDNIKHEIWYSILDMKIMKTSFMNELNVSSRIKNTDINESLLIWKANTYSSST